MILDLLPEGDPFLLKPVPEFSFAAPTHDPVSLAANLVETMHAHRAFGLAAIQCGLPVRAFVLKPLSEGGRPIVAFNPKIRSEDIPLLGEEGCLSFPGLYLSIARPSTVTAEYQTETGEVVTTAFTNTHARGFIHETEHLNGIVFTRHVSRLKLDMAQKKRRKHFSP